MTGNNVPEDKDDIIEEISDDPVREDDSCSAVIKEILASGLGIIRNEEGIKNSLSRIDELIGSGPDEAVYAKAMLARAMLLSALSRKESRGAHYREDHPDTDDSFRKTTVASYDGDIVIEFAEIDGGGNDDR